MAGSALFCYYASLSFLLTHCSSAPFVLHSSGRRTVSGLSVKAQPDGSLKLGVTQIDSFSLYCTLLCLQSFFNKADIYLNFYFEKWSLIVVNVALVQLLKDMKNPLQSYKLHV